MRTALALLFLCANLAQAASAPAMRSEEHTLRTQTQSHIALSGASVFEAYAFDDEDDVDPATEAWVTPEWEHAPESTDLEASLGADVLSASFAAEESAGSPFASALHSGPEPASFDLPEPLVPSTWDHVRSDAHRIFPDMWADTKAMFTRENIVLLTLGVGVSLGLRSGPDDDVRRYVARHPRRWGDVSRVLGDFGDARIQVPILAGVYLWSLGQGDDCHNTTEAVIRAYALAGLTTLAVKGIANTERPSTGVMDGEFGFPSHHTAGAFAIAAVLDERFGAEVGMPLYMLAGLIGWSRIDEQAHDLSDVVFGAVIGYTIGKTVGRREWGRFGEIRVTPYVHPTEGATGIGVVLPF